MAAPWRPTFFAGSKTKKSSSAAPASIPWRPTFFAGPKTPGPGVFFYAWFDKGGDFKASQLRASTPASNRPPPMKVQNPGVSPTAR